jgi:hypothetical protein
MLKKLIRTIMQLERSILRILLAGLLLLLILMPIAAHSDLIHSYWGAHLIAYHEKLPGFQSLLRYGHAGYLWLITALLPPGASFWPHITDAVQSNPFSDQAFVSQNWFEFISHVQIFRILFLLKLPYLIFDLGCVITLSHIDPDRLKSKRSFLFWWLNPILIFAVYVFGRHEVIALFFIILSLFWIKRNRENWGFLALGVAIALRYYALLLLPFYTFSLGRTWRKRFWNIFISLTPWLILNTINWSLVGKVEATGLVNLPHDNYLLALKLPIAAWDNLYVFPLLYFLLLLHRLYNQEHGLQTLVQYNLSTLLLMFATAYTGQSPQYWTWLLPFLVVGMSQDKSLFPLHVIQVLCLVVYSFIGSRSTAGYLFAPISPDFFWSLPSPVEVLGNFASHEVAISMARTAFSAVSFWMTYLVLRKLKSTFSPDVDAEVVP